MFALRISYSQFPVNECAKPQAAAARSDSSRTRAGFSLTELLVVIGIIVLLVGILLVALGAVQKKARKTQTLGTMNAFAGACQAFQSENGRYPGVIPDEVINANPSGGPPQLSSTENALLELIGGFRVLSPFDTISPPGQVKIDYDAFKAAAVAPPNDPTNMIELVFGSTGWSVVIDKKKLGEGPIVNGKLHGPYFTARKDELQRLAGQLSDAIDPDHPKLPDLADAWGNPIIYIRQSRNRGPLTNFTNNPPKPQFEFGGVNDYLRSTALGELGRNQLWSAGNPGGSILTAANTIADKNFALILRHPGISPSIVPPPPANLNNVYQGSPKGSFVLISAGPDGVYFSAADGPGSSGAAIPNGDLLGITTDAKVIDEFDDIVVFGGG